MMMACRDTRNHRSMSNPSKTSCRGGLRENWLNRWSSPFCDDAARQPHRMKGESCLGGAGRPGQAYSLGPPEKAISNHLTYAKIKIIILIYFMTNTLSTSVNCSENALLFWITKKNIVFIFTRNKFRRYGICSG